MKLISILFLMLFSSFLVSANDNSPGIVGKIIKAQKETDGSSYFLIYKDKKKTLAFPISSDSKVKSLDRYVGETVKISGKTVFRKTNRSETSHLLYIQADRIQPLKLKDLKYDPNKELDHEMDYFVSLNNKKRDSDQYTIKGIDNDVANTAIFVGGAILAAEVLGKVLNN